MSIKISSHCRERMIYRLMLNPLSLEKEMNYILENSKLVSFNYARTIINSLRNFSKSSYLISKHPKSDSKILLIMRNNTIVTVLTPDLDILFPHYKECYA